MKIKGQGSIENLLIISAAIVVVAIVIVAVYGIMTQGNESVISGEEINTGTTGTLRELQGVEIQTIIVPDGTSATIEIKPSATDDKLKNMFKGAPNGTGFTVNNGPNSGSTCQRTATGWVDANGNGCNTPITSGTLLTISNSSGGGGTYTESIRGVGTTGGQGQTVTQTISPGTPTPITLTFTPNQLITDLFTSLPSGTTIAIGTDGTILTRTTDGWILTLPNGTTVTDTNVINSLIPLSNGTVLNITTPAGSTTVTLSIVEGTPPTVVLPTPIQLSTCADLQNIQNNLVGNYELASNIDCSTLEEFTPITDFRGTLNGKGHKISNLSVYSSSGQPTGLFSTTNGATIKKLSIEGAEIIGLQSTGILVGNMGGGIITEVHTQGNVQGTDYVGGIVGRTMGGQITNSYSTSSTANEERIRATGNYAGGITGSLVGGGSINSVYSEATVEAQNYTGGIVGEFIEAQMANAYFSGTITSSPTSKIGGVIGKMNSTFGESNLSWMLYPDNCAGEISYREPGSCEKKYNEEDFMDQTYEPMASFTGGFGTGKAWSICQYEDQPWLTFENKTCTPPQIYADVINITGAGTIYIQLHVAPINNTLTTLFGSIGNGGQVRKLGDSTVFTNNSGTWTASGGTTTPAQLTINTNDKFAVTSTMPNIFQVNSYQTTPPFVTQITDTTPPTIKSISLQGCGGIKVPNTDTYSRFDYNVLIETTDTQTEVASCTIESYFRIPGTMTWLKANTKSIANPFIMPDVNYIHGNQVMTSSPYPTSLDTRYTVTCKDIIGNTTTMITTPTMTCPIPAAPQLISLPAGKITAVKMNDTAIDDPASASPIPPRIIQMFGTPSNGTTVRKMGKAVTYTWNNGWSASSGSHNDFNATNGDTIIISTPAGTPNQMAIFARTSLPYATIVNDTTGPTVTNVLSSCYPKSVAFMGPYARDINFAITANDTQLETKNCSLVINKTAPAPAMTFNATTGTNYLQTGNFVHTMTISQMADLTTPVTVNGTITCQDSLGNIGPMNTIGIYNCP